jgi:SAM-dependent methyltransferase
MESYTAKRWFMDFDEIDWNRLWQEGRRRQSWKSKKGTDWDRRAVSYARRDHSAFVTKLFAIMRPEADWTVLEVGSGPGTVALPLACHVRRVTAVDFSEQMLVELQRQAAREGIENIETRQLAWEEDWLEAGIASHQVTLSCRSLTPEDLRGAIEKLNRWAERRVFIVDRVGAGPHDPDLFAAIGREFVSGPDYIYTYNLLYQMGIYARVDFITLYGGKTYGSREEATDSCRWTLGGLNPAEEEKLERFLAERLKPLANGSWLLRRRLPPSWAVLWWEKRPHEKDHADGL